MDAIPSAAELASQISAAKQKYIDDGQQIWSTFPEKVVTLHALHSQMSSIVVSTGTASRPLGQSNDGISELAEVLKGQVVKMIEDLDALRLWIALRVPKIEDGNNFSVSVQDDIIGILASGKTSGLALIDSINRNLSARGEVMRKVMKYPHIVDYAHTLYEMDVQQQSVLMHTCIDLRNNYAILFDLINKNFVHLQHPKGPNEHAIGML